jgi:hypothetical protein
MKGSPQKDDVARYLSTTVVDTLDISDSDPDYDSRKVKFLLEASGEDLTTLSTVGGGDGKIDAYRIQHDDGDGHMVVSIWQLSGPDEKTLRAGELKTPPSQKLKKDLIGLESTLKNGQEHLTDDGTEAVREVRERLLKAAKAKRDVIIQLTILSLYEITSSARKELEKLAKSMGASLSSKGSVVSVEPTFRDAVDFAASAVGAHQLRPALGKLDLHLANSGSLAEHAKSLLAFVKSDSLIEFYRKHQAALLHANARFSQGMKRSTANPQIAESANDAGKVARFHELNNGLVITCTGYTLPTGKSDKDAAILRLTNPQVVNGGQTLHTLTLVNDKQVSSGKPHLVSEIVLPAKIVRINEPKSSDDPDLARAEEIAIASNRQTPLTSRALASYEPVNRKLVHAFAKLSPAWFFEHTDGAWNAFNNKRLSSAYRLSVTGRGETSDFMLSLPGQRKIPRKLVNSELIEALLTAYGCFDEAKPKKVFDESVFPSVLSMSLSAKGWSQFASADEPSLNFETFSDLFDWEDAKVVPVHLFLLVWILFKSISHLSLSEARVATWVVTTSQLKGWRKVTKFEEWQAWATNLPKYHNFEWAEHVANAMQKPLIFLVLRLLTKKYGSLNESTCAAILRLPQFERLAVGETPAAVLSREACRESAIGDLETPIYTLFQITRQACAALFNDHKDIQRMASKQQTLLKSVWVSRLCSHLDALTGDLDSHSPSFLIGTKLQTEGIAWPDALPSLKAKT